MEPGSKNRRHKERRVVSLEATEGKGVSAVAMMGPHVKKFLRDP